MSEMIGYAAFLFMGLVLGVVGAGGSIIAVPIIAYFFHKPFIQSTTYSLLLVGITSLVGVLITKNKVDYRKLVVFSAPSLITIFIVRYYIMNLIPLTILDINTNKILSISLSFIIMIFGYLLLKNKKDNYAIQKTNICYTKIIVISIATSIIMGLFGVGGGFVIVPSLILFLQFTNKETTSSSLVIIALSSLVGFISDVISRNVILDIWFIAISLSISVLGLLIGSFLNSTVSSNKIKKLFGILMVFLGPILILKEIY